MARRKINILTKNTSTNTPLSRAIRYAYANDAGADIASNEAITISAHNRVLCSTGLFMVIPPGYEIQIRSRSGLAYNHGIIVLNSPSTIDAGYEGEIKVLLLNTSNIDYFVNKGDYIAQLVLAKVVQANFKSKVSKDKDTDSNHTNVDETDTIHYMVITGDRGSNGFGSTG